MNLWAKRAGLLLSAAVLFFLISCEDDSFLLGFKGKTKFKGIYQEFGFEDQKSSVLLLDSVFTDQYSGSADPINVGAYRYLIGQYLDPSFGTVSANFYAQYLPNNSPNSPPYFNTANETIFFDDDTDSATVQFLLDFYAYGPEMTIYDEVDVYSLDELSADSLNFYERFFNTSTLDHKSELIGQLKIKKYTQDSKGNSKVLKYNLTDSKYRNLEAQSVKDDTLVLQGRLQSEFAFRILGYINQRRDSALTNVDSVAKFRKAFPGLAFVSTKTSRIIGVNPLNALSRLTFFYHTPTKPRATLSLFFTPFPYVGSNGFSNITTARSGLLSGIDGPPPYTKFYPSDDSYRYIQDGSTVITELDLSDYYSFIDTLEDIVINSAEISLEVESPPAGIGPPASLYALIMKETGGNKIIPLDMRVNEDSLKWRHYVGRNIFTDLTSFAVSTELSDESPLALTYNSSSGRYVGYATLFFQTMFDSKDKPEFRIEHLGLYPAIEPINKIITTYRNKVVTVPIVESGIGNKVNRAILKTSGIKLKLYYTIPNKPNLE